MSEETVEKFRSTSGAVTGVLALVLVVVVVVSGIFQAFPDWVFASAALVGLLVWIAMLRPALWAVGPDLVMRNMLTTIRIPLAAIEEIAVRQVLAVRCGDRRFVSPAVGRPARKLLRPSSRSAAARESSDLAALADAAYPEFVEARIRQLAEERRAVLGIKARSEEQRALAADVRRVPAFPELAALAIVLACLGISLL